MLESVPVYKIGARRQTGKFRKENFHPHAVNIMEDGAAGKREHLEKAGKL